jgi:hypothetical protein
MAHPERAADWPLLEDAFQGLDPPGRPPDLELAVTAEHSDARRVVPPILQTLEAVHDDPDGALASHVADDATHG